ncbi:unnamed protein product [Boreogadus saida]
MEPPPDRELLCIFGTGDLGRSLGQRLLQTGYRVVYGSRRPHSCGPLPPGAQVLSHTEAAQLASLIFICVHREHYDFLETLAPQLKGKLGKTLESRVWDLLCTPQQSTDRRCLSEWRSSNLLRLGIPIVGKYALIDHSHEWHNQ